MSMAGSHTVNAVRLLDVPRERVFAAWTRAEHLAHWFGPRGFTIHSCEADARPGGVFRLCMRSPEGVDYWVRGFTIHSCEADARPGGVFKLCMRSPDGVDYWVRGSFREVAAPERVVIHCTADDAQGVQRLEEVITVSLTSESGKTKLTLHATASGAGPEAAKMLRGMEQGWSETLERLRERSQTIQ